MNRPHRHRFAFALAALASLLASCGTLPRELIVERWQGEQPAPETLQLANSARFKRHVVAADHPEASAAGAEMLEMGGNAVDAAVATSFALSVVRPDSCGIGGGGFMVVHLASGPRRAGQPPLDQPLNIVIDYRERAPASASPEMFVNLADDASRSSGKAVAVPGTVAGLLHALDRYGTLTRQQVLAPAIRLARNGYVHDHHARRSAAKLAAFLAEHPERPGAGDGHQWTPFIHVAPSRRIDETCTGYRIPSANPNALPQADMRHLPRAVKEFVRLVNPSQAETLERIAEQGHDGYYRGKTAQAIIDAVNAHAGGPTLNDLANVRVREATPLTAQWRGRTILTMPLPSSGGVTLIQSLALMERTRPQWRTAVEGFEQRMKALNAREDGSPLPPPPIGPEFPHFLAESYKHAFADRSQYLGDPAFMPSDPTPRLLDPARLDAKAALIDLAKTLADEAYANAGRLPDLLAATADIPDDHGTSHLSVVDQWGNAVACTETINLEFGSRILVPECGFFLNNQMDDFQTRPGQPNAFGLVQSDRNLPQPGKCPLSSMTPTIVLGTDGKVESVLGASGGPRIITGVVQSLLLAHELGIGAEAVGTPRIHHQWKPAVLRVEPAFVPYSQFMAGPYGEDMPEFEKMAELGDAVFEDDKIMMPIVEAMRLRGHTVQAMFESAAVQMIHRDPAAGGGGGWHAASDPRKGGAPAGE